MINLLLSTFLLLLQVVAYGNVIAENNLIEDPSFKQTQPPNQFGLPFVKWEGWRYAGETEFAVGLVGHSDRNSALLIGKSAPKIRIWQKHELNPGRYRITAFLRGLDISKAKYGETTEFMFNDQYIPLNKNGTFGWSKLEFIGEVLEKKTVMVSFGLLAPGFLWVDDVSLEKIDNNVPLTPEPIISGEEKLISPPGAIGEHPAICPLCGYKNNPAWHHCYACGTLLEVKNSTSKPPTKVIANFDQNNPFTGGTLTPASYFHSKNALLFNNPYLSLIGPQDWSGYEYLNIELFSGSQESIPLTIELSDNETRDYWTRVNYSTTTPPGKSTIIIPINQLYVGEKARPGRMLNLSAITNFTMNIGDTKSEVYLGKIWLKQDSSTNNILFDGLYAYDFGTGNSPVLEGFTAISPATLYSKGRGFGLKDATIWRSEDALQPDPLYQDFICIESGGLAVDLPNGTYRVVMNIDSPSGYWGEYQRYKERTILAQNQQMIHETMNFNSLKNKYYRYWNIEDLPTDDTFNKYVKAYFQEKSFDVEVSNGQLNLEFKGENMANCVSSVIIFPYSKIKNGARFLKWVENKRQFYFDNNYKRVLHKPSGDPLTPSSEDKNRGYTVFNRDVMSDLFYNDTPFKQELIKPFSVNTFAGLIEPLSISIIPLKDLGQVSLNISDLIGSSGTIPANSIDIGYVSYRISRITMDGSIYTIAPRIIIPSNTLELPKDIARRFWLTIKTPIDSKPGIYKGQLTIKPEKGIASSIPVELQIHKGKIDPVDIPVGPFGYTIDTPWIENDTEADAFNNEMSYKSLAKLREYGFTMFSGVPKIEYSISDGKQFLNFETADKQMELAKNLGFLAVNTYGGGGLSGLNNYYQDTDQMKKAGVLDYSAFIKVIYDDIQKHAEEHHWIPIYWNLADEPIGDDLVRSTENAQAYKNAYPNGPPFFTGASSFKGSDTNDPHFKLNKAFHVACLNNHDEDAINLLHQNNTDWAFYNGGDRWTYGEYLYKAAKQFGLKFRLSWHWNLSAGDPYYALDSREDDYAWFHANAKGQLIPEVSFERISMGVIDYRMLLTLQRLINENKGSDKAIAAQQFINERLSAFKLGQRDHDTLYPLGDWIIFRQQLSALIESLQFPK